MLKYSEANESGPIEQMAQFVHNFLKVFTKFLLFFSHNLK